MAEDQARIERLEKANQELQERHAKSSEDISQIMEMLKMLTKNKQSTEALIPQAKTVPLRNTGEDPSYSQGFAFSHETQATYASPSQTFPFNYEPFQVINTPEVIIWQPKMGVDPVDPLAVPDLDEVVKKEKSPQDKALKKYELLKEKMRAM